MPTESALTFRLLFSFLNDKEVNPLVVEGSDTLFWNGVKEYLSKNVTEKGFCKQLSHHVKYKRLFVRSVGEFVKQMIPRFSFRDSVLYRVHALMQSHKEEEIDPNYYESKCVLSGFLMFLLKDAVVFSGILNKEDPLIQYKLAIEKFNMLTSVQEDLAQSIATLAKNYQPL